MARFKNRPPCPNCEGRRQRSLTSGWANDQTIPVTVVKCVDCGYIGHQFIGWLPDQASLNSLDADRRLYLKLYRRMKTGALAQKRPLRPGAAQRLTSDRIEYFVRVIPGQVNAALAAKLDILRRRRTPVVTDDFDRTTCISCFEHHARHANRMCERCNNDHQGKEIAS